MRNTEAIIASGSEAVRVVLNRPKNIEKGPFSKDLFTLYQLAADEMGELWDEVERHRDRYEAIMYEAADACAFLFAIIDECKARIELDKEMR